MILAPEAQAAFIAGIFAIILYIIKVFLKPSNGLIAFSRSNTEERRIIQLLKQIREEYDCSYIHILQYHNGGSFYSGKPRQRLTMTHEVSQQGKKQLMHSYQELPVSYFAEMADYLEKNGYLKDENIPVKLASYKSMIDAPYYLKLINEGGAVSHYAFAVYKKFWILHPKWPFLTKEDRMVASIHLRFDITEVFDTVEDQMMLEKYIDELKEIITD